MEQLGFDSGQKYCIRYIQIPYGQVGLDLFHKCFNVSQFNSTSLLIIIEVLTPQPMAGEVLSSPLRPSVYLSVCPWDGLVLCPDLFSVVLMEAFSYIQRTLS